MNNPKILPDKSLLSVDRAITELRKQRPVLIENSGKYYLVYDSEFATSSILAVTGKTLKSKPMLLISNARAKYLELDYKKAECFVLELTPKTDLAKYAEVFKPEAWPVTKSAVKLAKQAKPAKLSFMLELAKHAELLPSVIFFEVKKSQIKNADFVCVQAKHINSYGKHNPQSLDMVVEAAVPLHYGDAKVVVFRPSSGGYEHMAVIFGNVKKGVPLVRVHSSCITGDILGSLKCDCGDQLKLALQKIASDGCGVLVYVNQEGRGIGFVNKMRAYNLQEQKIDTMDANEIIGFSTDEREFMVASVILKKLGVKKIRLLTNNPKKINGLIELGIEVKERVPLVVQSNKRNANYLKTKAKKAGHLF